MARCEERCFLKIWREQRQNRGHVRVLGLALHITHYMRIYLVHFIHGNVYARRDARDVELQGFVP